MSNRTDLSNLRNLLIDVKSDLRGLELRIISIEAAGDVGRAQDALQTAIGLLTDALTYPVDQTAADAFGALCA